jgi:hypothetical protein
MKRMLCFISQQLLPNFIPVNETTTRPDALHAVFTPQDRAMNERWQLLKRILERKFPSLQLHDVEVASAYDARDIRHKCEDLLRNYPSDDWSLNMTGGTKLMSSPAVEVFRDKGRPIFYVETPRNQMLQISFDWTVTEHPFTGGIDLETYFGLHGRTISVGSPRTGQEGELYRQLQKLDWKVWPSVCLYDNSPVSAKPASKSASMAEYDAIGIRYYQLFAFECKRLSVTREAVKRGFAPKGRFERMKDDILIDLHKLSQVQQSFGGPFGRSYWVFSGEAELSEVNEARIKEFRITLIRGGEINRIHRSPENFGLPPVSPPAKALQTGNRANLGIAGEQRATS